MQDKDRPLFSIPNSFHRKENILFTTGCLETKNSGTYHSLQQTAKEMNNRGHKVSIVGTCKDKETSLYHGWHGSVKAFKRLGPFSLHFAPDIKNFLENNYHNWDLVSMQGIWMHVNYYVAKWCLKNNKPFMLTPHGGFNNAALRFSSGKKKLANLTFMRDTFKHVTCYQALTYSEYQAMREYGITSPICIIGNGIDIPFKTSMDEYLQYLPENFHDKRICLYIGRLASIKGLERLISIWKKLALKDDWQLIIAGSGEFRYESKLHKLAVDSRFKNIHFIGSIHDVLKDAWLRHSDFIVLPSFSEAFPMAILEGLAYERPCLLTEECGLPEISEFEAGMEVKSNQTCISDALEYMCSKSRSDLHIMGKNGLRLIQARYNWTHIVNDLEKVYAWLQGKDQKPDCVKLT